MKPDPENMMGEEKAQRVAWLVAGYLRQTLSETEHDELDEWINASDDNQRLFEELIIPAVLKKNLQDFNAPDEEAALQRIKNKIPFSPVKKIKPKRNLLPFSIAASIILLAGIAITYQYMKQGTKTNNGITISEALQPGGNYATLTLANGKNINLATAKNGLLDSDAGSDVLKTAEGQLSYENSEVATHSKEQHILSTPKGGQYTVTLPDGSRVWLNAASTLKYPVVFDEKERVVELSGEGYFEIKTSLLPTSPQRGGVGKTPFIVKLRDGAEVKVSGTHFNINAYTDEVEIKTTLLEGSVRVECERLTKDQRIFKTAGQPEPGDQAVIKEDGDIRIVEKINTDEAIAWKNGQFKFVNEPIENIMRQVARWYDATIIYNGKINYHLNATIYRNEPLSKLLELLEMTNRVHFKIEGKTITVSP